MTKKALPIVTITRMGNRWAYYQIFLLGLYELQREGKIRLIFRCEWTSYLSTILPENRFMGAMLDRLRRKFTHKSLTLEGVVDYDGERRYFCIDSSDGPFDFDSRLLDNVDVYFKMQCPKEIDPSKGFRLCDDVWIPYCDHYCEDGVIHLDYCSTPRKPLNNLDKNLSKIKPLLNGFRQLARQNTYKALKFGYENYRKGASPTSSKKMMCYFGNAKGPKPHKDVINPDWIWEADITGYFGDKVQHPNEKRAIVAKILQEKGDGYDARIISEDFADKPSMRHDNLIVPLKDFCSFISDFEYNLNISGYRMSIPSRFIESFIVGTAIVTDKLSVKWFLPFDEEVIETAEMGYLPEKDVDWEKVKKDIDNLPQINRKHLLELYEEKWAPKRVAYYIVDTILELFKKGN